MSEDPSLFTRKQEISSPYMGRSHVVILGAGASKAALPMGDRNGKDIPLMRQLSGVCELSRFFPEDLQNLACQDFEMAYSKLYNRGAEAVDKIETTIKSYFSSLLLPNSPNLYDALNWSLREKDAIFTFNWDPFLLESRNRLAAQGLTSSFPQLYFLHGNVSQGYCNCESPGTVGMIHPKSTCSRCGNPYTLSKLLFPVENKDYDSHSLIKNEWDSLDQHLQNCFVLTIFGYGAPSTDKVALERMKKACTGSKTFNMNQVEIINRPGCDKEKLLESWRPIIHTHHYDVYDSFYKSSIARHPRRSIEAYWAQNYDAKFVKGNPLPKSGFSSFEAMKSWYKPLVDAEERYEGNQNKK